MHSREGRDLAHRRQLLHLSPAERLKAIAASRRPAELVRSLPAQEFFLTLAESAGAAEGAKSLLEHANRHQIDFLFDVDAWRAEGFDPRRAGRWVLRLHEAGPEVLARWLREGDEATVVLVLSRLLRVFKLDASIDEERWPPEKKLPSLEGVYFLEADPSAPTGSFHALWAALALVREEQPGAYAALLEQVLWSIPAEQEEAAWEERGSRLAERGFPEMEEALAIWYPAEADARALAKQVGKSDTSGARTKPPLSPAAPCSAAPGSRRREDAGRGSRGGDPPVAGDRQPARVGVDLIGAGRTGSSPSRGTALGPALPEPAPHLARALQGLEAEAAERVLHDIVRLGNRFAVASLARLGDPATHREGFRQALSHVNLGLELLAAEDGAEAFPAACLEQLSIWEICGLGTAAVQRRAARANALLGGWLGSVHLARERLDAPLRSLLLGLAGARPRYTAWEEDRPFREVEDLGVADELLDTIEALGAFLTGTLGADTAELPGLEELPAGARNPAEIEWSAVALTAVARAALGEPPSARPLDEESASRALDLLLPPEEPPASMRGGGPGRRRHGSAGTVVRSPSPLLRELLDGFSLGPAARFLEGRLTDAFAGLPAGGAPAANRQRALLFT